MRPMLKTALRRCWRDRESVQFGVDPAHAVVLEPVDGPAADFLDLLDGTRSTDALTRDAGALGLPPERVRALLAVLADGGVLDDAAEHAALSAAVRHRAPLLDRLRPDLAALSVVHRGPGEAAARMRDRRSARVRVHGAGRVGAQLAALLSAAGVGTVEVVDTGRVEPWDTAPGGIPVEHVGERRDAAARGAVRRAAPELRRPSPGARPRPRAGVGPPRGGGDGDVTGFGVTSGPESGCGSGSGYGVTSGSGYGRGPVAGSGYRAGPGSGSGSGYDSGPGYGSASGSGCGSGFGGTSGPGSGGGSGAGYGSGSGVGAWAGSGAGDGVEGGSQTEPAAGRGGGGGGVAVLTVIAPRDGLRAYAPEVDRARELVAAGVPHLYAGVLEGVGVVGPLVLPGRTACGECVTRRRAGEDAAWPLILAQLRSGRQPAVPACDVALAAAVAGLAAAHALAHLDGGAPPSAGGRVELSLGRLSTRVRPVAPDAGCGCGAARGREGADRGGERAAQPAGTALAGTAGRRGTMAM